MLADFNGLVFGLSVLVAVLWLAGLFAVVKVREGWAFIFSAATIATFVSTLFYALYPRVMPSSLGAQFDLTITNASATENTLTVMSWVAVVMTPLVLVYQGWTYWVFRKRVSATQITNPEMGMLDTVHHP
jgi:cytochrome d ubiquinol oxidase subunit II